MFGAFKKIAKVVGKGAVAAAKMTPQGQMVSKAVSAIKGEGIPELGVLSRTEIGQMATGILGQDTVNLEAFARQVEQATIRRLRGD